MNYIYDIYLNFNENLYDFFDWDKSDKLTHIKAIPIFKVTEETLKKIITYDINLEKDFHLIKNKATVWTKSDKHKNYSLFCDENNIIAIEFDDVGNSKRKSFLSINDELEIIENNTKIKTKSLNFKIYKKKQMSLKTRKQENEETFIENELKNIDNEKLYYIYFECFGKKGTNKHLMTKKLLNLSKNSKTYINLYNILKLTSTTTK